nr:protein glutamine dumper 2-like [Tanacetum cinerariifolium]
MTIQAASSMAPQAPLQPSAWHSPVPYLFGGLAAMLGLIAFALLILACSYWKLSGDMENRDEQERDLEAGDSKPDNRDKLESPVMEEKYLVIMAGQANPTFLATPVSSRASSFGSCSSRDTSASSNCGSFTPEVQVGKTDSHETANQVP